MRLSTEQNDPGYIPWCEHRDNGYIAQVYCNGELITKAFIADEYEGFVLGHKMDADGNVLLNREGDDTAKVIYDGDVEILFRPRNP